MEAKQLIDLAPWKRAIFERLRKLIRKADPEIAEEWKWRAPAFSHNGLLCGIWVFENWVFLTFFQGSLIKDRSKLFNAGRSNDRNRTIKFTETSKINEPALLEYINEAVTNNIVGKKVVIKPQQKHPIILPIRIREELRRTSLLSVYKKRPYYQQKSYLSWIKEGKQEETKKRRIARMLEELRTSVFMPPKK